MAQDDDSPCKRKSDDLNLNAKKIPKLDNPPWQLSQATLKDAMSYGFTNNLYTDINFVVGTTSEKIPAIKMVLCLRSPVFYANFSGNWSNTDEIEVPDIEPEIFTSLLKFIHYDYLEEFATSTYALSLLYAANKYMLPVLETHCVDFLKKSLWTGNALQVLEHADRYGIQDLTTACFKVIDDCAEDVLHHDQFLLISRSLLASILERNTLRVDEFDLYKAALRWASAECRRQNLDDTVHNNVSVLKEELKLIRFSLIRSNKWFSLSDRNTFFIVAECLNNENVGDKETSRLGVTSRFSSVKSPFICTGDEEQILFTVDHDVEIVGIRFFNSCEEASTYDISIKINSPYSEDICTNTQTHTYTPSLKTKTFVVTLLEPAKLLKNTVYIVKFKIKGPNSFYGDDAVKDVSVPLPGNGRCLVKFETDSKQIPELLFRQ